MATGRTLYHVVFAELLRERAPPGFLITPEFQLATEPQQADFLLLRQDNTERHDDQARTLRRLWPLLPGDTLVEYKSPTRPIREGDVSRLLGYAGQYWSLEALRLKHRSELAIVLAVPSMTPRMHTELGAFDWAIEPLGDGYYHVDSRPFPGFLVVLDDVSVAERDELLQLVGHRTMETVEQNTWLLAHTAQGPKAAEMEKLEGYDELVKRALAQMPPRLRLEGMTPEQVREGLPQEELLLALSDDVLRELPDALIDKQPPEVRDEIRRRIRTH